jgi:L-fuconolactonase
LWLLGVLWWLAGVDGGAGLGVGAGAGGVGGGVAICDPHFHLWSVPGAQTPYQFPYVLDDFRADLGTVPEVRSSVFVNAGVGYRVSGPSWLRPVGESESLAGQRAGSEVATGIVSFADLRLGARVRDVLEAHIAAGGGRFRGVRFSTAWDASADVPDSPTNPVPGMLADDVLYPGLAILAELGLTFDAWLYFSQLEDVGRCADRVPDLPIVVNHLGGPLGIGPYAGQRAEVWSVLLAGLREVARRPNVFLKLGGIGMPMFGWDRAGGGGAVSVSDVVAWWRPLILSCIEIFGPDRCMFESNFPADRVTVSYSTLWAAYRAMISGFTGPEQAALLHDTAVRFYGLPSRAG